MPTTASAGGPGGSFEGELEAQVGGRETEPLVEAVGVVAHLVRGELDPVAAGRPGPRDGGLHELGADAPGAPVGMDVHGLDLGAPPTPRLEVAEHDQLAHADDLAVELGHQHSPVAAVYLAQGAGVGSGVAGRLARRTPRHTAQVQGVWVAPEWRGRGLGTMAMSAVVRDALRRVAPSVSLYVNDYNTPARRAYARCGFSRAGTFATVLL